MFIFFALFNIRSELQCLFARFQSQNPQIFVSRAFGARKALSHLFTWGTLKNKAFVSSCVWRDLWFLALFSVLSEYWCLFARFQYLEMSKAPNFSLAPSALGRHFLTLLWVDARKNKAFVIPCVWRFVCFLALLSIRSELQCLSARFQQLKC